ncbi:hypothetical protein D6779_01405 [Candidatus Parcubacteria bacterium]|nr:MAG: hypothetical protein D6779_01405 [Candidatus Parcubacteria bacterium]
MHPAQAVLRAIQGMPLPEGAVVSGNEIATTPPRKKKEKDTRALFWSEVFTILHKSRVESLLLCEAYLPKNQRTVFRDINLRLLHREMLEKGIISFCIRNAEQLQPFARHHGSAFAVERLPFHTTHPYRVFFPADAILKIQLPPVA